MLIPLHLQQCPVTLRCSNTGSRIIESTSVLHILRSVRAPLAEDFDFQAKILARNVKEIKTFLRPAKVNFRLVGRFVRKVRICREILTSCREIFVS